MENRSEHGSPWRLRAIDFWDQDFRRISATVGSLLRSSLVAQWVKNLPAVQETRVQSLGSEDPLEKEMAAHSSILAWRISWIEEPGGLQSIRGKSQTQLSNYTIRRTQSEYHILLVIRFTQSQTHFYLHPLFT